MAEYCLPRPAVLLALMGVPFALAGSTEDGKATGETEDDGKKSGLVPEVGTRL